MNRESRPEDLDMIEQLKLLIAEKEAAIQKIETYVQEKKVLNDSVQSREVDKNLEEDVEDLKTMVRDTFKGSPAAVSQKQKSNAKSLQYEGYKERRSKN